ncbi:MAG: DotH/IcmK family type IV secretion protein [Rhodanobacter sp.]
MKGYLLPIGLFLVPMLAVAQTTGTPPNGAAPASSSTAPLPAPGTPVPVLPPLPDVGKTAFKGLEQDMMPLSPDEIRQLRQDMDATQRAASEPPRFVPDPVSSALVASLSPGATAPVVRLFPGYVTNLLFIDESGHALQIDDVDIPDKAKTFTVTWSNDPKNPSNVLTVSPNAMYAMGNVAVHLHAVQAPVSVMLVSGQRQVDTRADIRVAGVGASSVGSGLSPSVDDSLQDYLDGMPPKVAKALTSSEQTVQIWSIGSHFIVRMNPALTLISPAYTGIKKSADGTTVYVIPPVAPLEVLSDGNPLSIQVSGY